MDLMSTAGFISAGLAVGYYCGYTKVGAAKVLDTWAKIRGLFGK